MDGGGHTGGPTMTRISTTCPSLRRRRVWGLVVRVWGALKGLLRGLFKGFLSGFFKGLQSRVVEYSLGVKRVAIWGPD